MKRSNRNSIAAFFSGFASLIIVFYLSVGCTGSANNRGGSCDTAAIIAAKCPDCGSGPSTRNLYGKYLDTLKLSKTDYETLRTTFPSAGSQRSKIVVQFYFNSANGETPSLIAYASKPGNQFSGGMVPDTVARVLSKGGRHTVQLPNIFVLGDQQITFDSIDGLLPASPHTPYTLLFIPRIPAGEINVLYDVCIDVGAGPSCPAPPPPTQPSPPANAN